MLKVILMFRVLDTWPCRRHAERAVLLCAALFLIACQGLDRLEPDRPTGGAAADRGTILDPASNPGLGGGGRLTEEIAGRWVRRMEATGGEERLQIAAQFLQEYPEAQVIGYFHELVGDAHTATGQSIAAAESFERAIETSWPAPDILELPLVNLELPYRVGWARFEAGTPAVGSDWLVRTTFISDLPQLEQGLRFLYAELGSPGDSFAGWLASRRDVLSAVAPDFELPGYQQETLRLSELGGRLTLINFWTPT